MTIFLIKFEQENRYGSNLGWEKIVVFTRKKGFKTFYDLGQCFITESISASWYELHLPYGAKRIRLIRNRE